MGRSFSRRNLKRIQNIRRIKNIRGTLARSVGRGSRTPSRYQATAGLEDTVLRMQNAAGNQAVEEWLQKTTGDGAGTPGEIGDLRVSRPDDPQEQEARRLASELANEPSQDTDRPTPHAQTEPGSVPPDQTAAPALPGAAAGDGRPLPMGERATFEPRLGLDLSQVRLHTGPQASRLSRSLNARAFTLGRDIYFAEGQSASGTPEGRTLLAHELTHVAQQTGVRGRTPGEAGPVTQTAGPQIQRDIFGDIWEGIQSAGEAIGGAISSAAEWVGERAREVGSFLSGAAEWVGERMRDAAMWAINLIRDLPERLARLATTLWEGLVGVVTFIPEAIQALASGGLSGFADWLWEKAKAGGAWVLTLLSRVFDVLGGPEIVEFIWHILTNARRLNGAEIAAASQVLGPDAIRWDDVRVSESGLLELVFALNEGRAFVMFHTVNLPAGESTDTVVHELTHVYQYERAGSVYLGQAIHAQITRGAGAYDYGGPDGLVAAQAAGRRFSEFNREEQAQIAQDYYRYVILGERELTEEQRQAYEFYIAQLRAGEL